jgi:hypothetical protein
MSVNFFILFVFKIYNEKKIVAVPKYMSKPVMSTTVVMAGLAATAGSPPKRFTNSGKPAPITVAVTTCKANASEIIKAITGKE